MPLNGGCLAAGARRWWRALVAEALATALLVLLGVASTLPAPAARPLTHPAFAFGLVIVMLVQAFGPASGAHMNPAVTLAALLGGHLAPAPAAGYVLAQLLGGLAGFGALSALVPEAAVGAAGVPLPGVAPLAAVAVEAVLTGLLALLCCALWAAHDPLQPDHAAPLKLGLGVAGLVYAGGPLTGAALNPARALGPAVFRGVWTHHWVYWVGPLGGAALAALLQRFVLAPRPAPPRAPEALPLQDKGQA